MRTIMTGAVAVLLAMPAMAEPMIFGRDIRPLLSNNCFDCHGPDDAARQAGLRLDTFDGATLTLASGKAAIVPGDPDASELLHRITAHDSPDLMPPPSSKKAPLSEAHVERLRKWIQEGAVYEPHYAFETPARPALPKVASDDWVRNPIDAFVLRKLEAEGLAPSPEADRRTLIRRVTFDLTGLPPTPEEVRAFVDDERPEAYERLVDRLMNAPAHAEHMARYWLDISRYADTNGYHIDNERFMWRWRDWVIDAYAQNMPFDDFTVNQLAGDLLEEPSKEQLIATGFNRNHMVNFEGGAIPEEYRVQYVNDRVETTSTAWLGLTMRCAQCHDHKYDPISQREYFELYAFFNTVAEQGLDGQQGNAAPVLSAPLPEHDEQRAKLEARIAKYEELLYAPRPELDEAQAEWEQAERQRLDEMWEPLKPMSVTSANGTELAVLDDQSVVAAGPNPDRETYTITLDGGLTGATGLRMEVMRDPSMPGIGYGRAANGNFVLTHVEAAVAPVDAPESGQPLTLVSASANHSQPEYGIEKTLDGDAASGWAALEYDNGDMLWALFAFDKPLAAADAARLRVTLKFESPHVQHGLGRMRFSLSHDKALAPSGFGPWYVNGPYQAEDGAAAYDTDYGPEETGIDLSSTYEDGRLKWVRATPQFEDGQLHDLPGGIAATYLYRTIDAANSRMMTITLGSNDAIKAWLNGEVVHDNNVKRTAAPGQDRVDLKLREGQNDLLLKVVNYGNAYQFALDRATEETGRYPVQVAHALAKEASTRSPSQNKALKAHYRRTHWDEYPRYEQRLEATRQGLNDLEGRIPSTMIMAEMETPRETFILARGEYDQPGEKVEPSVPEVLGELQHEGSRATRLELAQWLVSGAHPLTARVVMNREWGRLFGTGLVKTVEDLGVQGEWPSHPELLDWLAVEFVESGWDLRHMMRLMATSAAYRQQSTLREELLETDPNNRLLARAPRFRMDAEVIRDNALAVSGLLVRQVGGKSVKPYQPEGLWKEVAYGSSAYSAQFFEQDEGEALWRRSMYTFWKRTSPPPSMMVFDAPNRETCTARRERTNTPLQALTLMNDVQFVEAARFLAQRMITEGGQTPEERIEFAARLLWARPPNAAEKTALLNAYENFAARYQNDRDSASALLDVGDGGRDESLDDAELAAWSLVASVFLNADETVTKS